MGDVSPRTPTAGSSSHLSARAEESLQTETSSTRPCREGHRRLYRGGRCRTSMRAGTLRVPGERTRSTPGCPRTIGPSTLSRSSRPAAGGSNPTSFAFRQVLEQIRRPGREASGGKLPDRSFGPSRTESTGTAPPSRRVPISANCHSQELIMRTTTNCRSGATAPRQASTAWTTGSERAPLHRSRPKPSAGRWSWARFPSSREGTIDVSPYPTNV